MDSSETGTERLLAELALPSGRAHRVLSGGLGLGYTVAALSALEVDAIDVVEIEQCLIDWAYQGIAPSIAAAASDPRVQLHAGDIRLVFAGVIEELVGPWDAIVLDVDNGPDFLIHPHNRALYTEEESPGGVRSARSWRNVGDLVPRSSSGAASRSGTHWVIGGGAHHRRFSRRAQLCVRDLYGFPRAETSAGVLGQNGPMTYATDVGDYRIERDTMGEVRVPAALSGRPRRSVPLTTSRSPASRSTLS